MTFTDLKIVCQDILDTNQDIMNEFTELFNSMFKTIVDVSIARYAKPATPDFDLDVETLVIFQEYPHISANDYRERKLIELETKLNIAERRPDSHSTMGKKIELLFCKEYQEMYSCGDVPYHGDVYSIKDDKIALIVDTKMGIDHNKVTDPEKFKHDIHKTGAPGGILVSTNVYKEKDTMISFDIFNVGDLPKRVESKNVQQPSTTLSEAVRCSKEYLVANGDEGWRFIVYFSYKLQDDPILEFVIDYIRNQYEKCFCTNKTRNDCLL